MCYLHSTYVESSFVFLFAFLTTVYILGDQIPCLGYHYILELCFVYTE